MGNLPAYDKGHAPEKAQYNPPQGNRHKSFPGKKHLCARLLPGAHKSQQTADSRNAQINKANAFPVDNSCNNWQCHENGFHIHDPAQHINDYTSIHVVPPAFTLRYPSNH